MYTIRKEDKIALKSKGDSEIVKKKYNFLLYWGI